MSLDPPNSFDAFQLRIIEAALINARHALTDHEDGGTLMHDFKSEIEQIDEALTLLGYEPARPNNPERPRRVP